MTAHAADKLVRMANQIAAFFGTQPAAAQAADVAAHLKAFWEPRMLQALYAHVDAGGEGLDPLVLQAVGRLRQPA